MPSLLNMIFLFTQDTEKFKRGFSLDFKIKAIETAKLCGNRQVARDHGFDESLVRKWRRNEDQIRKLQKSVKNNVKKGKTIRKQRFRLEGAGAKLKYEQIEDILYDWIIEKRAKQFRVTEKAIIKEAHSIAKREGIPFAGSFSWCSNFMNR